jgi:predicted AlkP superfamily pyrophosphatase or phosphodiesterase
MRTRRLLAALALAVGIFCAECRTTTPVLNAGRTERVFLISFDGLSANDLDVHLRNGIVPAFGRLIADGTYARSIPVNPTLTAPAHISIASGADPQKTGIVSNSFHIPGTPRTKSASGFDAPFDTDTLWESARRQGRKVGVITFPGVDGKGPRRSGDWGLVYSHPIARSKIIHLQRRDFVAAESPTPGSYSTTLKTSLRWEFSESGSNVGRDVELMVLDTTNDHVENYDVARIRVDAQEIVPDQKRWFPVSASVATTDGNRLYGSWSKIMELDPQVNEVVVYWGPITSTAGYPASYREMIDREVGFWPGPPDDLLSEDWLSRREGVDPETYIEQLQRFSKFFTDATILSMRRMPWDLILTYQPIIDEAEHQYRIVNERQQWSTPENRQAGERVREQAYRSVDLSLSRMRSALPSKTTLVVTGDHGLDAVDTQVRVNRLLVEWGFALQQGDTLSALTRWAAFTGGSMAHLYGFEKRSGEVDAIVGKLRELRSPDGDLVFELVRTKTPQDHRNSGDIIATAYPRFSVSSSMRGVAMSKSTSFGQHGGLNHHDTFHTVFIAAGPGVPAKRLGQIPQTDIAGRVSAILGITPPLDADPVQERP